MSVDLSAIEEKMEELEDKARVAGYDQEAFNLRHQGHYSNVRYAPWDVIHDWGLDFDLGCVVKYVERAGKKDGESKRKDLLKARNYIDHELEWMERENGED